MQLKHLDFVGRRLWGTRFLECLNRSLALECGCVAVDLISFDDSMTPGEVIGEPHDVLLLPWMAPPKPSQAVRLQPAKLMNHTSIARLQMCVALPSLPFFNTHPSCDDNRQHV